LLEGKFVADVKKSVPLRDSAVVARALPHLALRFANFDAYGRAGISEIIDLSPRVRELSINTLQSMVFLNYGTHFEALPLPMKAQLSPVFGLGVADFDGDGHQDVLLAQNFFAVDPMTSRYDGGRGLLLLGKGDGTFRSMPGSETGIAAHGEGRGLALCDYDRDGRVDACIGQNGAQTKLYHNEIGQPGLRVRLKGMPSNPTAIGAVVRPVLSDNRLGAAYEIHAGSGWLSQDSAVSVLGPRAGIRAVEVRWPGGKTMRVAVPEGASEIQVNPGPGK
jgi:enediyne biosynthesis protein E4